MLGSTQSTNPKNTKLYPRTWEQSEVLARLTKQFQKQRDLMVPKRSGKVKAHSRLSKHYLGRHTPQVKSVVPASHRYSAGRKLFEDRIEEQRHPDQHDDLKLLTFNIQVGIQTSRYRHYVTRGWKHVLPHEGRTANLNAIADLVSDYDFVALQEIDGGSLRSGFVNQVDYLAQRARFPYWHTQTNRNFGRFAQQGNGLLSRVQPVELEDHKLPGAIPGRGAIVVRLPFAGQELLLVLIHLSLGERSRRAQLGYVRELVAREEHVIVMGDMNSHLADLLEHSPLQGLSLCAGTESGTYPAWRPSVALDHILVSKSLAMHSYEVLDCTLSDHRPIGVSIRPAESLQKTA